MVKGMSQEGLANSPEANVADVSPESGPTFFTAFRGKDVSPEEQAGIDRLFEMMMVVKQQILLRRAHRHE